MSPTQAILRRTGCLIALAALLLPPPPAGARTLKQANIQLPVLPPNVSTNLPSTKARIICSRRIRRQVCSAGDRIAGAKRRKVASVRFSPDPVVWVPGAP